MRSVSLDLENLGRVTSLPLGSPKQYRALSRSSASDNKCDQRKSGSFMNKGLPVGIAVTYRNLGEIDTSKQTFEASIQIQLSWYLARGNKLAEETTDAEDDDTGSRFRRSKSMRMSELHITDTQAAIEDITTTVKWRPEIFLPTMRRENSRIEEWTYYPDQGIVERTLICSATFGQIFELYRFPFDCQDLTIPIWGSEAKVWYFVPSVVQDNAISIFSEYCDIPMWILHPPVAEIIYTPAMFCNFYIHVKVERKSSFYIHRIVFFLFTFALSSLMAFRLDVETWIADRLVYVFTVILVMVAFDWITISMLPKVPYLTYLDFYTRFTFTFAIFVALETTFVRSVQADKIFLYIFSGVVVVFHVFAAIMAVLAKIWEREKLTMGMEERTKLYKVENQIFRIKNECVRTTFQKRT